MPASCTPTAPTTRRARPAVAFTSCSRRRWRRGGPQPQPHGVSGRTISDDNLYKRLGGEDGVRSLVDAFYARMDSVPEARTIRAMHARDLRTANDKLFKFLSGWTGGPQLYVAEFGHPRLRRRHMPFAIDSDARDQWLGCMDLALGDVGAEELLRADLMKAFAHVADFMRNQPDP